MTPLHIAALALMLRQHGQANSQQRLGIALRNNPYYTPKPQAPIWNLARLALMVQGLKGSPSGGSTLTGDSLAFSDWA